MGGFKRDAGDDVDAMVIKHQVRIARYLLSAGPPCLPLAPSGSGRARWPVCCAAGGGVQRTGLRALEIIENAAPPHSPSLKAIATPAPSALLFDALTHQIAPR